MDRGGKHSEYAYYTDYSIGFLTRGCFRKCAFCVNKNYDRVCTHSPLLEFLDTARPKICLLDDNFFGSPRWKDLLLELQQTGKPFQFKQGLDERLLTDEKCALLFASKYDGDYIFAFDMSVAGRRAGLEGQQSVLFYQAIRIIKEMRCATNGKYPRYIVWENVPGAFSSNGGEDFKAVLEAVIGVAEPEAQVPMPEKNRWPYADCYMGDGWSVAYRVLDAQFWGVPQRRKRIYLVADFAGGRAFDILFKSEGLSGYSAESFRSWQRTAGSAANRTGATGFDGYNGDLTGDVSSTLGVNCGMSTGRNGIVLNDQGGNRMDVTDEVTATLRAEAHHPPVVMDAAGFCTEHSSKSRSIGYGCCCRIRVGQYVRQCQMGQTEKI